MEKRHSVLLIKSLKIILNKRFYISFFIKHDTVLTLPSCSYSQDGHAQSPSKMKMDITSDIVKEIEGRGSDISPICNKKSLTTSSQMIEKENNNIIVNMPEKPTSQELPSPMKRYFIRRFSSYLDKFQKSFANEMPDTFHMFRTFSNGCKEFIIDFRDYIKMIIKLSSPFYDLEDLSYRELHLYHNMPRQMLKVSPVLIISSLPFAQNIVLPISYVFPKQLLSYQFWDTQQKLEFSIHFLKKRLFNCRPVFRCLQAKIENVESPELRQRCQAVFYSLGSGIHPCVKEIEDMKEVFSKHPFDISYLASNHVRALVRLHDLSAWSFKRKKLLHHARTLRCMDNVIDRDGVCILSPEQIRNALFLRGINPTGLSFNECEEYLNTWTKLSTASNSSSSLILHLPILLAYNHPTNLVLIL